MDFYLYQIEGNENMVGNIKNILYLSNARADIVGNWLCANHDGQITYNNNVYIECHPDVFEDLYNHLKLVLNESDNRNELAMFYLSPRLKVSNWCSGSEMFSESYYADLEGIKEALEKMFNENEFYFDTVFLYHIEL